jgi:hypothetical protein
MNDWRPGSPTISPRNKILMGSAVGVSFIGKQLFAIQPSRQL